MERDHIIAELSKTQLIEEVRSVKARQRLSVGQVNHYVTDGEVTVANLVAVA
jgi:hypothetical protein